MFIFRSGKNYGSYTVSKTPPKEISFQARFENSFGSIEQVSSPPSQPDDSTPYFSPEYSRFIENNERKLDGLTGLVDQQNIKRRYAEDNSDVQGKSRDAVESTDQPVNKCKKNSNLFRTTSFIEPDLDNTEKETSLNDVHASKTVQQPIIEQSTSIIHNPDLINKADDVILAADIMDESNEDRRETPEKASTVAEVKEEIHEVEDAVIGRPAKQEKSEIETEDEESTDRESIRTVIERTERDSSSNQGFENHLNMEAGEQKATAEKSNTYRRSRKPESELLKEIEEELHMTDTEDRRTVTFNPIVKSLESETDAKNVGSDATSSYSRTGLTDPPADQGAQQTINLHKITSQINLTPGQPIDRTLFIHTDRPAGSKVISLETGLYPAVVTHRYKEDGNPSVLKPDAGEIVFLHGRVNDSWYCGQYRGSKGFIAASHVKTIPVDCSKEYAQAVCTKEFIGRQKCELSVGSGELVSLLKRVDPAWYLANHLGVLGFIPAQNIQILSGYSATI